ncbi:MAG: hypothetical protein HUU20_13930 [Pirellulales bacterium]|nr:hypothetical protein [Pirellulales bacterium]
MQLKCAIRIDCYFRVAGVFVQDALRWRPLEMPFPADTYVDSSQTVFDLDADVQA